MALYIHIRKLREDAHSAEYAYGSDDAQPGVLRIERATGAVTLISPCVPEAEGLAYFLRAEHKLRKHWKAGELPDTTCWAS